MVIATFGSHLVVNGIHLKRHKIVQSGKEIGSLDNSQVHAPLTNFLQVLGIDIGGNVLQLQGIS